MSQLDIFKKILDQTQDVVLVTKPWPIDAPDGPEIIYANKGFYELSGYTPKEVIGSTPRILQGPKTCKKTLAKIKKALSNQKSIVESTKNHRRYFKLSKKR